MKDNLLLPRSVGLLRISKGIVFGLLVLIATVLILREILLFVKPMAPKSLERLFRSREREGFAADVWQFSSLEKIRRYKMANDLVNSKQLLGLSSDAMYKLLGQPTFIETNDVAMYYEYALAPQKMIPSRSLFLPDQYFLNIENWILRVELRNGRVTASRIEID